MILYPVISDRVLRTLDYECVFLPDQNPVFVVAMAMFVVAMAIVGHHVPCAIIVVSYAVVYYEIRNLIKTRPQNSVHTVIDLTTRPRHLGILRSPAHLLCPDTRFQHNLHIFASRPVLTLVYI